MSPIRPLIALVPVRIGGIRVSFPHIRLPKTEKDAPIAQIRAQMSLISERFQQVMVAGGSYTPAQITEKLQAIVDLRREVDAAKATIKAKLVKEKTAMPALCTFRGALMSSINGAFVNQPDVLADFGISLRARTPLTAEAKTAAAAKRNATRAARHTMGSKQRKSVKGAVTGIVVTPVTAQPSVTTPLHAEPTIEVTAARATPSPT